MMGTGEVRDTTARPQSGTLSERHARAAEPCRAAAAAGAVPPLLPLRCTYTVGDRVVDLEGHLGTLRYIGAVHGYSRRASARLASSLAAPDSSSGACADEEEADLWLGVEWDDPGRGKHDGSLNGKVYFTCASPETRRRATPRAPHAAAEGGDCGAERSTAGSFVKRCKLVEPQDFKRAVVQRYTTKLTQEQVDAMLLVNPITNRTKPVEFVGREEAEAHFARLHLLNAMSFNGSCAIRSAGPSPRLVLPNLRFLSLSDSLITDWKELLGILRAAPRLQSLSLCGARLQASTLPTALSRRSRTSAELAENNAGEPELSVPPVLSELRDLQLDRTFITWEELLAFDTLAPQLVRLSIRANGFSSSALLPLFAPAARLPAHGAAPSEQRKEDEGAEADANPRCVFHDLEGLDISENILDSWESLFACLIHLPRLTTICAVDCALGDFARVRTSREPGQPPSPAVAETQGEKKDDAQTPELSSAKLLPAAPEGDQASWLGKGGGEVEARERSALSWALSMSEEQRERVTELCLEDNCLDAWETVTWLARLFPRLERLMLQGNPLLVQPSANARDKPAPVAAGFGASSPQRQVMIALFPNLKVLSGGTVSKADRCAAERYTLSLLHRIRRANEEGEFSALPVPLGLVEVLRPPAQGVDQTCSVHEALLDRLTKAHGDFSLGGEFCRGGGAVLASMLIEVFLQPDAAAIFHKLPVKKRVPKSMRVRDLKTLCMRLFGLPVAHTELLYNDGHMPVSTPLDDDAASLDFFGVGDGSVVRVQDKSEAKRP
ncbi:CAP-Gly domain-containing protein [Besnoitia besnoiti]|uniref:CAP-Gly domain-containing protein n=1 Tax=Besnoitia besnoiti TaxID=94643 RepID=A0A2A9MGU8_BESBE|nr:CAP-Gly domain-containing protein [Besnoitia besnoiti]PFH34817.1 CAP-Gly domain-containing protein [Besnoitia besnoiti]